MNIFDFREQLIGNYASYIKSFIQIRDPQISNFVQQKLHEGALWPELLITLNHSVPSKAQRTSDKNSVYPAQTNAGD
jgi:hypothetical protein